MQRSAPRWVFALFVCAACRPQPAPPRPEDLPARETVRVQTDLIAPTLAGLASVYATHDERLADHHSAEAVLVDGDSITVLARENPTGDHARTWLMQLSDDGAQRWSRRYADDEGAGNAFARLPGGGFIIGGEVALDPMHYRARLLRVGADGEKAVSSFGPPGVETFNAVVVAKDGSIVAGGQTNGEACFARTDASLVSMTSSVSEGAARVSALAVLDDGSVAFAAERDPSTLGPSNARVGALAPDLRATWLDDLPRSGRGELKTIAKLTNGQLVAVGRRATSEREPSQMWIAFFDPAGAVSSEQSYGTRDDGHRVIRVVGLADGGFAAVGMLDVTARGRRAFVARFTRSGATTWEHAYGEENATQFPRDVAQTADGGLVLVGSTTKRGPGKTNVWIVRMDGEGRVVWEHVVPA